MYLDAAKKQEIFEKYGKSNTDTGSAEAQIALFSYRISHLTEHLKLNRKDYSTERALTTLVGKRRALLNYLKDRDIERYRAATLKREAAFLLAFYPMGAYLSVLFTVDNADFHRSSFRALHADSVLIPIWP